MTKLAHILYFTLLAFSSIASRPDDEYRSRFTSAEFLFMDQEYGLALQKFLPLYQADSSNLNLAYRIGECYYHEQFFFKAIEFLTIAEKEMVKSYKEGSYKERSASIKTLYFLGLSYQTIREYDLALDYYDKFKNLISFDKVYYYDLIETRKTACFRAKELTQKPVIVEIENVGKGVNTGASEINPLVTADDSYMVFARRVVPEPDSVVNEEFEKSRYELYSAEKKKGCWSASESLNTQLQSDGLFIPVSMTRDGGFMVLFRDNYQNGTFEDYDLGALYFSEKKNGRWSSITKFPAPINSMQWESSAVLTEDRKTIYFSSDRKNGLGGFDLFESHYVDSAWTEPVNLGSAINTDYNEEYPALVSDSILVFASEKHDNMGGYDNFASKNHGDSWTEPINLGYPINSTGNENILSPTLDGRKAYFSAFRPDGYLTFGLSDIFSITAVSSRLHEGIQPEETTKLKVPEVASLDDGGSGAVLDAESASGLKSANESQLALNAVIDSLIVYKPAATAVSKTSMLTGRVESTNLGAIHQTAQVKVVNLLTKDTIANLSTDPSNQDYQLELTPGDYKLIIESNGYAVAEQKVFIPSINTAGINVTSEITPENEKGGDYYIIKPVYFEYGSADLTRDATFELERLAILMNANPSLYLEVVGHTDSISSYSFNKKLSLLRSKNVVQYLVDQGVSSNRFVEKGMSFDANIAINTDDHGRQFNRRVEMRVIKSNSSKVKVQDIIVPDYLKKKSHLKYSVHFALSDTLFSSQYLRKLALQGLNSPEYFLAQSKYYYYSGEFTRKAEAMLYLNKVIDLGFDIADIVDNFSLDHLQQQSLKKPVASENRYTLQLLALMKPCDVGTRFAGIAPVVENEGADGYYRYTFGNFKTKEAAIIAQKQISDLWEAGSFIVPADKFASAKKTKPAKYTVQVLALKSPVAGSQKGLYKNFKEVKGEDGFFRYISGRFHTWEEAEVAMNKLKSRGYLGAYITLLNKFD